MSAASEALGYTRPGRGRVAADDLRHQGEIDALASVVYETWLAMDGGQRRRGRLRKSLAKNAVPLLRLFGEGARVRHFGKAVIALGVTLDSGKPLRPVVFGNTWSAVEIVLAARLARPPRAP